MISKKDIIAMATLLKLDVAKVTAAYDATDEQPVTVPAATELNVFTPAELTQREETLKTRHEQAGMEIAIKNLKTETGLEYDGKDPKKFITEYSKKVLKDANIQESTKVQELNTTIEGLRTNIVTLTTEKETANKTAAEVARDAEILTWTIDRKPDNLNNKQWLALLKLDTEFVEHEGVQTIKREGKVVLNTTGDLKPVPAKDALIAYIDTAKIGKVPAAEPPKTGGRGGGDSKLSALGIANMKQFNDHLKEHNISANGDIAQKMLAEITKENPNFDFSTTGAEAAPAPAAT